MQWAAELPQYLKYVYSFTHSFFCKNEKETAWARREVQEKPCGASSFKVTLLRSTDQHNGLEWSFWTADDGSRL